jgi:hypothetical protein
VSFRLTHQHNPPTYLDALLLLASASTLPVQWAVKLFKERRKLLIWPFDELEALLETGQVEHKGIGLAVAY